MRQTSTGNTSSDAVTVQRSRLEVYFINSERMKDKFAVRSNFADFRFHSAKIEKYHQVSLSRHTNSTTES